MLTYKCKLPREFVLTQILNKGKPLRNDYSRDKRRVRRSSSKTNRNIESSSSFASGKILKFERDTVAVVESNVDDTTGEVLGRTIERLIGEGAFDATATPYLGKKGRMGQTIRVICSTDSVEKFAEIIVEETGTLGVKISQYTRLIVPRKDLSVPVSIEGFKGNVTVKVAEVRGRLRIKPEFSEARQISEDQKIPLREVLEAITTSARQFLAK